MERSSAIEDVIPERERAAPDALLGRGRSVLALMFTANGDKFRNALSA